MTKKLEMYRCSICGNIAQVLKEGSGNLVCCGQEMELLVPQYEENELGEKHVPVIETESEGCETGMCKRATKVKIKQHPMIQEHYIDFIEVYTKDKKEVRLKFFSPGEKPILDITDFYYDVNSLEYCNIHGLWRG